MSYERPLDYAGAVLRHGAIAGRGHMLDAHNGELGIAKLIGANESTDLLQISAKNQAEPLIVSVCLDVKSEGAPPAPPDGTAEARLQMVLKWAVQRGKNDAIVDYRVGATVTLTANRLNVSARYIVTGDGIAQRLRIAASVAYGVRPGTTNPCNTFTDELLPVLGVGATSAARPIPSYATAVAWLTTAPPASAPAATLLFRTNELAAAFLVAQASPGPFTFVPIPNGARFINLTNAGAAPAAYRLIYEVGL